MARPREFDEADVVGRARDAFWEHGVSATSISQLSDSTGLSVGSIYKAFNSKAELCELTLDDYLDHALTRVGELLDGAPTPLAGIEAWLAELASMAANDSPTRGCYAVMCAIELAEADPNIKARLNRYDRRLRGRVADALRSAKGTGHISADPDVGARLLCTTASGLAVEARKGISLTDAEETLALVLDGLR